MSYADLTCFDVDVNAGIACTTIANGPINLLDGKFFVEMASLIRRFEESSDVRVIVFKSANPSFFLAHADITEFTSLPSEPPFRGGRAGGVIGALDRLRTMAKPSIALIAGICRGGGSEFALACDMRFAAIGKAVFGQPEAGLGITPGAGAMTRLARLVGRGRALEILLGSGDFSAEEAQLYGWINRAVPAEDLDKFGMDLAQHIASFPPETVALIKQHLQHGEEQLGQALIFEEQSFLRSANFPEAKERMRIALKHGLQTVPVETASISELWDRDRKSVV